MTPPEMLILRALKLGDLLVAVPALRGLRRAFPEHRIRYAAGSWLAPLVDLVGGIELLSVPCLEAPVSLTPGQVDVAVNLHGSGPQSRRRLDELRPRRRIGHRFDGPGEPEWSGPDWLDEIHERRRWTRLLEWHAVPADPDDLALLPPLLPSPRPGAVVVHVGSAFGSRRWPVERFGTVVAAVRRTGRRVVVTGGADERQRASAAAAAGGLPDEDNLAGRIGLGELAALVAGASAVISVDTGVAHLASAYGRPSVVIFGPSPVTAWGPPPGPHIVLTDESLRRGDPFADDPDPALLAVQAEQVLIALTELG